MSALKRTRRERDPDRGYIDWRPTADGRAKLESVLKVLADYGDYLPVTLRQIFYILVSRLIIEKTQLEYRKLGYLLRKARRARLVPFEAIHDQGSVLPHSLAGWSESTDLRGWWGRIATLVDDAIRARLDLDRMSEVARRSEDIRDRFRKGLSEAGLSPVK